MRRSFFVKRIRNIFFSIIYLMFIQLIFLYRRKTKNIYCTILYYHSIPNSKIDRFKKQLHILNKITSPIRLDYCGPFNNKLRYSVITFDDAFKSVIENGLSEFKNLKIPFTLFVPAGCIGKNPAWLKNTGLSDENEIVCSTEGLLNLPSEIVTFGSHTINHVQLHQLNNKDAFYEIRDSKIILESKLKREIKYLAFPYGAYNSKIIELCHESGYEQVFSIIPESPIEPLRKYVKGRIIADPSDWKIEFVLKVLGGYGWIPIAISIKQGIKRLNIFSIRKKRNITHL